MENTFSFHLKIIEVKSQCSFNPKPKKVIVFKRFINFKTQPHPFEKLVIFATGTEKKIVPWIEGRINLSSSNWKKFFFIIYPVLNDYQYFKFRGLIPHETFKENFAPSILLLYYPLSSTNLWLIFLKDRIMKYLVFFIISLPVTTHGKCFICSRLAIKRR